MHLLSYDINPHTSTYVIRLVCKYMVSKPVDLDDVKCLDPDFYRQRAGLSAVSAVSAQLNQGPAKRHGSS